MVYAEVIVKQRTNVSELTYGVPAQIIPYLKVGSLVTVPLRRKQVRGVVVGLKRTVPKELRPVIKNISTIERGKGLSAAQIDTIRYLATYYGASLAEVAFHALNQPAIDYPMPENLPESSSPVFLQADWPERESYYLELIRRSADRHRILVICSLQSFADSLYAATGSLAAHVVLDNGKAIVRQRIEELVKNNLPFVLISTIQRSFFPLSPGDLLIVDQPDHIGAKQQMRPFMRVKTIAQTRAKAENLRLVMGAILPAVEDIPKLASKQWQLESKLTDKEPLTVINRKGSRSLFAPGLESILIEKASSNQKILVLVLARGWAPALVCADCGHIFECSNCSRTTSVTNKHLVCRYCHTTEPLPNSCPICHSLNIRPVGEGTSRVAQEIKQLIPQVGVQEFSSDSPRFNPSCQVTVATEKILSLPQTHFDTVVFLSTDRLLTGAELGMTWELFGFLQTFKQRHSEVIVETYFPDNKIWGLAGRGAIKEYFQYELGARKQYQLPPFAGLVGFVGSGSSDKTLVEQADRLVEELLKVLANAEVSQYNQELLPSGEHRLSFRVLTPQPLSSRAKNIIKDLLLPSWHLDIEP